MSYILEALKKSDQERSRGSTPGLQTIHTSVAVESKKRRGWLSLLILALFVNAGLLLWWLQPWKSAEPGPDRPTVREQTAAASHPPASPAKDDEPQTSSSSENQARLAEKSQSFAAVQNVPANQDGAPAETAPGSKQSKAPVPQPQKPSQPAKTAPPTVPKSVPTRPEKNSVNLVKEQQPQPAPANSAQDKLPSRAARTSAQPPEQLTEQYTKALDETTMSKPKSTQPLPAPYTSPQMEQLPGLKGLPITIQKEIPELTLSFLVYANKPADRLVNINGQMMR
ncbi:MAG: hypothetical protein RBS57_13315, partial [Desulforhabdus sp.]|nr:hypothetical protein [Desulforhabdus sp.]